MEVTASYSDVFKGLGYMEGALPLEVDRTVAPAIMPPRRVPLTLKDRLKDELTRLEKASVMYRSNRSFNMPPPRQPPGHLTF